MMWSGQEQACVSECRCGTVASAIIEKDIVGNPKGIAVIEFEAEPARKVALSLSGTPNHQALHSYGRQRSSFAYRP